MSENRVGHSSSQTDRHLSDIIAARHQFEEIRDRATPSALLHPAPSVTKIPGADSIEGYKLLRELHRGGQGVVYQALQESTQRNVAVKFMHDSTSGNKVARLRFEREAHVLGRLNHPNIVAIHDSGTASGHAYYVMDFVAGASLDEYVKRVEPTVAELLRLFVTICDAIHEAHVRGIIHRDLKPGNILVDDRDRPRILDFGLAKLTDAEPAQASPVTETGQFVGSMPWASPEQAEGRWHDIDVRTDVYSLGVIFYQLLTGSFPYCVTGNPRDVVRAIVETDPLRPSTISRRINHEVETVLLKCLQKERSRRYQSAGELARDLRNYLEGRPIEAKRDSGWYVLKKTVLRHRVPVAFAVLVAAFGIAALVGLIVAHERESRLRSEALRQASIAQAVNRFLNDDLLGAVRPQEAGRDVTVREVLDTASRKIENQFPGKPVVEAAVRETLGNTYMELGEWNAALAHAERALDLGRTHLGAEHPDTLSAMQLVGRLYRRVGRYTEAEKILHEMVESARATLGPEDPLTTQGMNNLAYALVELGRRKEALAVNSEALEIRTKTLGPRHPDTLKSLHNQAYYIENFGRYAEAEQLYEQAYRIRAEVLGPDHPDTLASMGNLANSWTTLGRLDDAAELHRERLDRLTRVLGERHPITLRNLGMLGDVYRRQGRFDDAEPLLVKAYDEWHELVGDSHLEVAQSLWRLGELYIAQERFEEAEDVLLRAHRMYRDTVGPEHLQSIFVTAVLGRFYLDRARYEESEPLLIAAEAALRKALGKEHRTYQSTRQDLVDLYAQWEAAEPGRGHAAKADRWRAAGNVRRSSPENREGHLSNGRP